MNRWFGVGEIKHAPKLTHVDKPEPILRLSVVTSDVRDDGSDSLQWHNVVLKGQPAVDWSEKLGKGDTVGVVCEVKYYSSARGGTKRRITEMSVQELKLVARAIDSKPMVSDDDIPF